jgi:hypothetical protein
VTVISEKSIPRPSLPTPTRSSTMHNVGSSANQRLKGLLSGKSPSFDKALPTPTRTGTTPPAPVIPPPRTTSSPAPLPNNVNGSGVGKVGGTEIAATSTPPPLPQARKPSAGFKQVEISLPPSEQGPEPESAPAHTEVKIPSEKGPRSSPPPSAPPPPYDASPEPATTTTTGPDPHRTEAQGLDAPASGAQSSSLVEEAD